MEANMNGKLARKLMILKQEKKLFGVFREMGFSNSK